MNSTSITAPPSKSVSHRAAIAAALSRGESRLFNMLDSDDINRTLECLQSLGTVITGDKDKGLSVQGGGLLFGSRGRTVDLNVGESGTTCRLLTPVAALAGDPCRIHGEGRMHERPVGELAEVLQAQGAEIEWLQNRGYPPFIISSKGLFGGEMQISLEQSSQFLSGLLLAAPFAETRSTIHISGDKVVSWPYVALTLQVMEQFGAYAKPQVLQGSDWEDVDRDADPEITPGRIRFQVDPCDYKARDYTVEGDWSNASYFLAAGILLPNGLELHNLLADSIQGDRAILEILSRMGAEITGNAGSIFVQPGRLYGADLDMGICPDLVPTVAVMASLADTPSRIRNVHHLRFKESDRLSALASEISKTGCDINVTADGLEIQPKPLERGNEIHFTTYGDHRIAMSLSLYELAGIKVNLDQPECVQKSFPDFWEKWKMIKS
ncbi:MAG: 3-phosphoshikimate 1-carboxyvinyltransferase [Thermodesulfobacteriota bacterium]